MKKEQLEKLNELYTEIKNCEEILQCFLYTCEDGTLIDRHPKVCIQANDWDDNTVTYRLPPLASVNLTEIVYQAVLKEKERLEEEFEKL